MTPQVKAKPMRKIAYARDTREHRKIQMDCKLAECDWSQISAHNDVNDMVNELTDTLTLMYNECFPLIKVKISSRDPPFMSPLIKHLCNLRNKSMKRYGFLIDTTLQERINNLIRENQVREVRNEAFKHRNGSKGWWDTVNKITGRKSNNQMISSIIEPETVNSYFKEINTSPQYTAPEQLPVPNGTRIPTFDVNTVKWFLLNQKRTAAGPDQLPHWLWKDYAHQLAPIITMIFNCSIMHQSVPALWKTANVRPIPKESPVTECTQLRPISLTNIIMRLFERLVFKQEMSTEFKSIINNDQFGFRDGCNTTLALLKCQHFWLSALDRDSDFVRVLSFDFSKAFDTLSHKIICDKLKSTNINPYIINWIISFLDNRKQRVVVDDAITAFVSINRGVPQGTVLGLTLFSLMVNDIAAVSPMNNLLVKYADDITISVPVRQSTDTAAAEVEYMKKWADINEMSLNFTKTWEMCMHGKTTKLSPPELPGIKRKSWLKLLGVTFQEDVTNWDIHIDNMLSKASSRMYILRVCKSDGYSKDQLNNLFNSLVMSVFLHGIEVWGAAYQRKYLDRIDRFLKRAHRFGFVTKKTTILDLIKDRDSKLFKNVIRDDHILHDLLSPKRKRVLRERKHDFIFPRVRTERFKQSFLNRCIFY